MYKNLYVLGDSLSDNGAFVGIIKHLSFAEEVKFDPPAYEGKSFSDGKVAAECLSDYLGIELKPGWKCSMWGRECEQVGNNYAISNASAAQHDNYISRFFFNKLRLEKQVNALISHHKDISQDDLFLIMIGGNDIMAASSQNSDDAKQTLEHAIDAVYNAIEMLHQNNASNIIIANAPDIGLIPAFNKNKEASKFATELTDSFNDQLKNSVRSLQQKYHNLKLKGFELNAEFNNIINQYESEAKNYTDAATSDFVDKLLSSNSSWYDKGKMVSYIVTSGRLWINPCSEEVRNEHLFFDYFHPTKRSHEYIGKKLYQMSVESLQSSNYDSEDEGGNDREVTYDVVNI
ncbi:SGNH/GDSL hydrolase family protein [Wolbachia pipientis]|nr:SGNH/GDSL hydrolase family protein [Wolbachia pipientis]